LNSRGLIGAADAEKWFNITPKGPLRLISHLFHMPVEEKLVSNCSAHPDLGNI
jgi:hypothetical protein